MGRVVLAQDLQLERPVALKLMETLEGASHAENSRARFLREADALSRVRHPHVVELHDFGVAGDTPYLVLEYLEGTPLDRLLEEAAPGELDPAALLLPVAEALEVLHTAGLVHRDVKPANIMVTRDRRAVLVDFGLMKDLRLSRLTRTGALVGTLGFLPPESQDPERLGPPTDFYALGVTWYQLACGRLPFTTPEVLEWITRGQEPALAFPGVDPFGPTARLLRACLRQDPSLRPASRRAMERLLEDESTVTDARPSPRVLRESADVSTMKLAPASSASGAAPARSPPGLPRWAVLCWALVLGGAGLGVWGRWGGSAAPPAAPGPNTNAAGRGAPDGVPSPPLPDDLLPGGRNPQGAREFQNLTDGSVLVLVPGARLGLRRLRDPEADDYSAQADGEAEVDAFLLGKTEVTVAQYQRFLDAQGLSPPPRWDAQLENPANPVVLVTLAEARSYAAWAGGRLPTAAEWQLATGAADGRPHPWGEAPPTKARANYGHVDLGAVLLQELGYLQPVGHHPEGASPLGLLDLVGNVAEWTTTEAPGSPPSHLCSGGAWVARERWMTTWFQRPWPDQDRAPTVGLRLARSPPPALAASQ